MTMLAASQASHKEGSQRRRCAVLPHRNLEKQGRVGNEEAQRFAALKPCVSSSAQLRVCLAVLLWWSCAFPTAP